MRTSGFLSLGMGVPLAIAAAAAIYIGVLHFQLANCKANNADLAVKASVMGEQIKRQNAAVDNLKAESEKKRAEAAQKLADARKRAEAADGTVKRLKSLLGQHKPSSGKSCTDAWREIRK